MGWIRLFYMWRRAAAYLSSVFCLSVSCLLWTSASISVFSLCYQDRLTLLSSCVWNCRWFGARMPTNRVIIVIFFPDFGTREEEGAKRWCLTLWSENDTFTYMFTDVCGERKHCHQIRIRYQQIPWRENVGLGCFWITRLRKRRFQGCEVTTRTEQKRTDVFANWQSHLSERDSNHWKRGSGEKERGRLVSKCRQVEKLKWKDRARGDERGREKEREGQREGQKYKWGQMWKKETRDFL